MTKSSQISPSGHVGIQPRLPGLAAGAKDLDGQVRTLLFPFAFTFTALLTKAGPQFPIILTAATCAFSKRLDPRSHLLLLLLLLQFLKERTVKAENLVCRHYISQHPHDPHPTSWFTLRTCLCSLSSNFPFTVQADVAHLHTFPPPSPPPSRPQ